MMSKRLNIEARQPVILKKQLRFLRIVASGALLGSVIAGLVFGGSEHSESIKVGVAIVGAGAAVAAKLLHFI